MGVGGASVAPSPIASVGDARSGCHIHLPILRTLAPEALPPAASVLAPDPATVTDSTTDSRYSRRSWCKRIQLGILFQLELKNQLPSTCIQRSSSTFTLRRHSPIRFSPYCFHMLWDSSGSTDKSRVSGLGLASTCFARPNNKAWWAPSSALASHRQVSPDTPFQARLASSLYVPAAVHSERSARFTVNRRRRSP